MGAPRMTPRIKHLMLKCAPEWGAWLTRLARRSGAPSVSAYLVQLAEDDARRRKFEAAPDRLPESRRWAQEVTE
jgi:hypothetical protein